jgi:hypothetical protein
VAALRQLFDRFVEGFWQNRLLRPPRPKFLRFFVDCGLALIDTEQMFG